MSPRAYSSPDAAQRVSTLAATRQVLGWCVLNRATVRVVAITADGAPSLGIQPGNALPPQLRRLLTLPDVRLRIAQYLAAGAVRFCTDAPDAHSHAATCAGFAHIAHTLLDVDQRERFQERAAVREFDGGMNRPQAELFALFDVLDDCSVIESVAALAAAA